MGKLTTILGGGGNFSPHSIGNLELWLDAKDEDTRSYLFWYISFTASGSQGTKVLTASGDTSAKLASDMIIRLGANDVYVVASVSGTTINITTPLTTNYTNEMIYRKNISDWNDKSSNANHATQSNTSYQPIALYSTENIRFDSDYLETANNSNITGNADFTVCLVHKLNSTAGGNYGGWFGWGSAVAGESSFFGRGDTTESKYAVGFLGSGNDGGSLDTNLNCLTWVREGGTNNGQTGNSLYKNGSEITLENVMGSGTIDLSATPYLVGKNINGYMNNEFSELLVFSKKLSAGERVKVENYLQNKWGV